jgi:curved DNA-binding protein CbpA
VTQDPDPYAVLGVAPGSSTAVIRKAYHALARAAHPDLVGDGGLAMMQRLNGAWFILRDPGRRAAYDATQPGRHQAGSSVPSGGGAHRAAARPKSSHEPAWTGAAGAPPGRPSGSRLDFGLYAGWTLGEIARYDTGYLAWLRDRKEGRPYAEEIKAVLEHLRPANPEASRPQRRWRGR